MASSDAPRYLENTMPMKTLTSTPKDLLQSTLETLIETYPVLESYDPQLQKGIFSGYTSLAYLLLQIHRLHPDVCVQGKNLRAWTLAYLEPIRREELVHGDDEYRAGSHSESLSVDALYACLSGTKEDVQSVLASVPQYLDPERPYMDELFYGRAGLLYLLRLVKSWAPAHSAAIDESIAAVVEATLQNRKDRGNWTIVNTRYYGPAHGDIGILVQLVLSKPSIAPDVRDILIELLDLQQESGNWPTSEKTVQEGTDKDLVQFCHGAPGFVLSLQALRPFYPDLQERIDKSIERGRLITWERGLSVKEPSLCHGILSNALALPPGPQRDHFLSFCTLDAVQQAKEEDPELFQQASYTSKVSPLLNYLPSAAWTWAVCEMDPAPIPLFTDV